MSAVTSMTPLTLDDLLGEYAAAQAYSLSLIEGLDDSQVAWRPHQDSSAIGWHLGHQGAVNHYLVRNLTAAEVTFNADFDRLFDSATPETARGDLPAVEAIIRYREDIAASTIAIVQRIVTGGVGAPTQLRLIATGLMLAVINHEYQHAKWIGEVRATMTERSAPEPDSDQLVQIDGYWTIGSA